jgi:hypothetical protein
MSSQQASTLLGENAYWLFISFLYASIIVDIAKDFDKVVTCSLEKPKRVAVGSHLVFASFVVGTSWVAWTLAFVNKDVFAPKEVISLQSSLLIVDFVILAMYFSFATIIGGERESGDNPGLRKPYYKHSSSWVGKILTMYVVWDIFAYFLIPKFGEGSMITATTPPSETHFWAHSWMSFLCASLAWLAFLWLRRIRSDRMLAVVMGDLSLIMLILFYRALKQMSHAQPLPSGTHPAPLPISTQIVQLINLHWLSNFALGSCFIFFILFCLAGVIGSNEAPPRPTAKAAGRV